MTNPTRIGVNFSFIFRNDYCFIDHIRKGFDTDAMDANGWPSGATEANANIAIPDSDNFAGPYVLKWNGAHRCRIFEGTWTIDTELSTAHTENGNGDYTATDARLVLTYDGPARGTVIQVNTADPFSIIGLSFYRLEDEARLQAGKVFRIGFLQPYVDMNPLYVRLLNWQNGTVSKTIRAEHLNDSTKNVGWNNPVHNQIPKYGTATLASLNSWTVDAVSGTPVAMLHGEICRANFADPLVRIAGKTITGITKADPAVVRTSTAHGYTNGERKLIRTAIASGMHQMHWRVVTVANATADTFECAGVDSSAFGAFLNVDTTGDTTSGNSTISDIADTSAISVGMNVFGSGIPAGATVGSKTANSVTLANSVQATATADDVALVFCIPGSVNDHAELNVGDRGVYPILWASGNAPASTFNTSFESTGYQAFYFDKNQVGDRDIQGAWVMGGFDFGQARDGVPIEIAAQFFTELHEQYAIYNAANPNAVQKGPTHCWTTMPPLGLLSVDPDYDADQNVPVKVIDILLNGRNGYSGIPSQCEIWNELSNETWNFASGFWPTFYYSRLAEIGGIGSASSPHDYHALRSVVMVKDIQAAFPGNARLKFIMAGQGTIGVSAGNSVRINGSTFYDNHEWNTWGAGNNPIDFHDYFAFAHYTGFQTSKLTAVGETEAGLAAEWLAATTDTQKEAIFVRYLPGYVGAGGESIEYYRDTRIPEYASALHALGKFCIAYEGGPDTDPAGGASDDIDSFRRAFNNSRTNADTLRTLYDKFRELDGAIGPAHFILIGDRWCMTGTSVDTYNAAGVEGGQLFQHGLFQEFVRFNHYQKRTRVNVEA